MRRMPILLSVLLGLAFADSADARPAHKQAAAKYFGRLLPKKLNDCVLCHLPDNPSAVKSEEDNEKPHNAFGERLSRVKDTLRKAGKKTTIDARLDLILQEDADGDGVSNLVEILNGHSPGDKADRPTAAKLAESKGLLVEFTKLRDGYPWRPFEVVKRPEAPRVKSTAWVRNPIDAFIAAEHEALGLKPQPEAPREVLLRRVYLDLIGLPPTPEDLHAFLKDVSPDAFEKVVDRLLAAPQYGERWGRHWMDVWRYSDWAGFGAQIRDSQPHIWRWRDWIIDSLNEDKPYDRMIQEMIAGDELAPEDPKALIATGYLVRNWKLLSREKWMQDTVEHTFMAFQGLTLGCAKCHDHMFDPLLQTDYYQVRAIFEPHNVRTDRIPGKPDTKADGIVRVFDKDLAAATYLFLRGDDRTPDKSKPLTPGVPESLGGGLGKIGGIKLPPSAVVPERQKFVIDELLAASRDAIAKAEDQLKKAAGDPKRSDAGLMQLEVSLAKAKHDALVSVLAVEELEEKGTRAGDEWKKAAEAATMRQRQAAVLEATKKEMLAAKKVADAQSLPADKQAPAKKELDDAKKALAKAEADAKAAPTTQFTRRFTATHPAESTGRRLAFARWLTDKDNPLTARVAVNHIWLRHFGQGIVPSVFDFGNNGRPPSHPALLDWLAAELTNPSEKTRSPWSMKHLHRLMVTSAAYRLASTPDETSARLDRDNKYLWRFTPRQAEAEVVRDSIFHVAGKLDLTRGGPELDYPLGMTVPRRSVYFRHAAEKQMEFLQIFDGPSVTECYERKHSIVPQQALALINNQMTLRHARLLARNLAAKLKDDRAFVAAAFEHVLTRSPNQQETAECVAFLAEQAKRFPATKNPAAPSADGAAPAADPALRARENLVHVLMNHHEFVTIR